MRPPSCKLVNPISYRYISSKFTILKLAVNQLSHRLVGPTLYNVAPSFCISWSWMEPSCSLGGPTLYQHLSLGITFNSTSITATLRHRGFQEPGFDRLASSNGKSWELTLGGSTKGYPFVVGFFSMENPNRKWMMTWGFSYFYGHF